MSATEVKEIDARGCPGPLMETIRAIREAEDGFSRYVVRRAR